jgi:hypothetical protein
MNRRASNFRCDFNAVGIFDLQYNEEDNEEDAVVE